MTVWAAMIKCQDENRMKKKIIKLFTSHGLNITLDLNLVQVNFLDVTLNINNNKFWPYRKPNNEPLYIHKHSNHPPNIKKQLPQMINKRLSEISCDSIEFDKVK